jgi:hypothetical protein
MKTVLIICLMVISGSAWAEPDVWVNAGFLSHHFKRVGLNEQNTGVGVEVDKITVGVYRNSVRKTSTYVGYKYQPFSSESSLGALKAGLTFAVIDGYPDFNNSGIAPMIIPTISIEGTRFGANFVLSPTYRRIGGFVAIQVKVKLDR